MVQALPDPGRKPDVMSDKTRLVRRFWRFERALHIVLMTSFLGLAFSGMPLLFADQTWAGVMARIMGGYAVTGVLHRFCAVLLIAAFLAHLGRTAYRIFVRKEEGMLWGPDSLVPQPTDAIQLFQHVRWFVGLGPRPRFDKFTYWEKFDYWAVFWGMAIIGTSGLMMWFPGLFTIVLPGWVLNIAIIIHGEEALLAVVFIFTIHFFNGHLRPEKFPLDTVMFTGRISVEELEEERPAEYERLVRAGRLEEIEAAPPPRWEILIARAAGLTAVGLGILMVLLTIRGLLLH